LRWRKFAPLSLAPTDGLGLAGTRLRERRENVMGLPWVFFGFDLLTLACTRMHESNPDWIGGTSLQMLI